ncbi:MAG: superoxide dismutase [Anaerolineaceae bacterium]
MPFELPTMKYGFEALEPIIDARTVEIHQDKHHATYLKNLNTALEIFPQFFDWSLEKILSHLDQIPEEIRTAVKNNGGGVYNHNLYWAAMAPSHGGKPIGALGKAIDATFGSFDQFKVEFEKAGIGRFGSGYAWLSVNPAKALIIHSTANQDCPLQENLQPVLVVDVWEHAYYLQYQNRRAEYLSNWWPLVDWQEAENRYQTTL